MREVYQTVIISLQEVNNVEFVVVSTLILHSYLNNFISWLNSPITFGWVADY